MNYKEIRELIDLISDTDVLEIEVERSGTRVKLRRESKSMPTQAVTRQAAAAAPPPRQVGEEEPEQEEPPAGEGVIRAPLVGTFYRSPGPDAAVFVEAGDHVSMGQTLCIVEAMKLMNEIEAEFAGIVREIYAENGQPVEYGQPLFRIERTG